MLYLVTNMTTHSSLSSKDGLFLKTHHSEHVIFSLGKSIKMIELDNRDRRDIIDLLTLDIMPLQLLPRFGADKLYVVLESSSDALGGNTVFDIDLPQYATLFGL